MAFTPPSSIAPSTVIIDPTTPVAVTVAALPLPAGAATEATLARAKRDLDEIAWDAVQSAGEIA